MPITIELNLTMIQRLHIVYSFLEVFMAPLDLSLLPISMMKVTEMNYF